MFINLLISLINLHYNTALYLLYREARLKLLSIESPLIFGDDI